MLGGMIDKMMPWLGDRRQPPVAADRLLYAVGDVHGRSDLLMPLIDRVFRDALVTGASEDVVPEVIFLGDMIDRGPDSRGVLEFLMMVAEWPEIEPIFLIGNHELMLLQFLDDPVKGRNWLRYGGYETLQSYGMGRLGDLADTDNLRRLAEDLKGAMGPHLGFLSALRPWHVNGNLFLTHAGADPALPPDQQSVDALVWGESAFLRGRRKDGLWVVHGHTVVDTPSVRQGRIAIDTGAYLTGKLTVMKVRRTEISFLTEIGEPVPEETGD